MTKTVRRLVLALALLGVAYAGIRWGPTALPSLQAFLGPEGAEEVEGEAPPSPELAEATLDRFERFRGGQAGDRLALGSTELTSVVRYSVPGLVPAGIGEPEVRLRDGRVHVAAEVAVADFPRLPSLEQVVGFLPDTLLVDMRGSLVPLDQGHLSLVVDRIRAARIPVPGRMIGGVLDGLRGGRGTDGSSDNALPVPLPDGLDSVFVQRDSLVLISERARGN